MGTFTAPQSPEALEYFLILKPKFQKTWLRGSWRSGCQQTSDMSRKIRRKKESHIWIDQLSHHVGTGLPQAYYLIETELGLARSAWLDYLLLLRSIFRSNLLTSWLTEMVRRRTDRQGRYGRRERGGWVIVRGARNVGHGLARAARAQTWQGRSFAFIHFYTLLTEWEGARRAGVLEFESHFVKVFIKMKLMFL